MNFVEIYSSYFQIYVSLAVKGEDIFLVASDQQDWGSQITWQDIQPGQVESAGTHSSPPHRHGSVTVTGKRA